MAQNLLKAEESVREVVGVFDDVGRLRDAIADLQQNGFMRQELSFLADEKTVSEKMGGYYSKVQDLADDPRTPRAMFMPDEPVGEAEAALIGVPLYVAAATATAVVVASGGTLLAALAAAGVAGIGAGALGGVLARYIADHHAHHIQQQIEKGGMILWVHSRNPGQERKAREILQKHAAIDIHIHDVLRRYN
jgi:hypothetical protein